MGSPHRSPTATVERHALDEPTGVSGWAGLLAGHPRDPAFSIDFIRALGEGFGLTPHLYLARQDGAPAAGALLLERRKGPFRAAVVPSFVSYTPWLGGPHDEAAVHRREALDECLLSALERDFDQARIHLPPSVGDVRPFQWRGWRISTFYTYQIPLAAGVDPIGGWSESARRRFASARAGYRFHDTVTASQVLTLSRASYARQGRPFPVDADALIGIIETLQQKGLARLFGVEQPGAEPAAAVALLHAPDRSYYWIAGSTPGDAMTVLLGHLLPALRDEGVSVFDFVGANTPSIAEFKRRFGGILTPYYTAERIAHPVLKALALLKRR
ncbi:MAG: GNAT family N-acetyltransferase [Rhodothermales bacterium]